MAKVSKKYSENKKFYENNLQDIREEFGGKMIAIINKEVKTLDNKLKKELTENSKLRKQAYMTSVPSKNNIYGLFYFG